MQSNKNYQNYNKKQRFNNSNDYTHYKNTNYIQLPPASTLLEYEELSKGAADKIMEMIEAEQIQRHEIENYKVRTNNKFRYFHLLIDLLIIITVSIAASLIIPMSKFGAFIIMIGAFILLGIGRMSNISKSKLCSKDYKKIFRNRAGFNEKK